MQENPCISFLLSSRSKSSCVPWLSAEHVCGDDLSFCFYFKFRDLQVENNSDLFSSFIMCKEFVKVSFTRLTGDVHCTTWRKVNSHCSHMTTVALLVTCPIQLDDRREESCFV